MSFVGWVKRRFAAPTHRVTIIVERWVGAAKRRLTHPTRKILSMPLPTRRDALAAGAAALAGPTLLKAAPAPELSPGKAEACIFMWLGGGMCQIDTFDPKRLGDGKKVAGSAYPAIDTAVPGIQVCEHLPKSAAIMDRLAVVRTLNHDVIDEHAAAVNRVHTGRRPTESVVYPSVGSVVAHMKGAADAGVPAYVVVGYPNISRGPGFLGPKAGYVYLTETAAGPAGLTRPADVDPDRQSRRADVLAKLRAAQVGAKPAGAVGEYVGAAEAGFKLAGPDFLSAFDLDKEPAALRESYGGEFGQRCLLARRLVERGTRFVEVSFNLNFVNGTGWDTHKDGQKNQHVLIRELDSALSALVTDLQAKRSLDKVLVVVATEFGRPPEFDGAGGRGHHGKAFSGVLAGGRLRTGRAVGATDDLGRLPVEWPVSVPDFHATMYHALGIDTAEELYAGDRPVPITDGGKPIAELFTPA